MAIPKVDEVYERLNIVNLEHFFFAEKCWELADTGKKREIAEQRKKIEESILFLDRTIKKIDEIMQSMQEVRDHRGEREDQKRLEEIKEFCQDILTRYYKIIHRANLEISDPGQTALRHGLDDKNCLGLPLRFPLREDEIIELLQNWLEKHGLPDTLENRRLFWEKWFRGKPIRHFHSRTIKEILAEIDGEGLA